MMNVRGGVQAFFQVLVWSLMDLPEMLPIASRHGLHRTPDAVRPVARPRMSYHASTRQARLDSGPQSRTMIGASEGPTAENVNRCTKQPGLPVLRADTRAASWTDRLLNAREEL